MRGIGRFQINKNERIQRVNHKNGIHVGDQVLFRYDGEEYIGKVISITSDGTIAVGSKNDEVSWYIGETTATSRITVLTIRQDVL